MKYITNNLIKKEEYFIAILNTLIYKYGPIEVSKLEFLYEQNTQRALRIVHQYSDIASLIQKFPCQFKIQDGLIVKSDAQEIINKICLMPVAPPELYFSTCLDSRNSKANESKSPSKNNIDSFRLIKSVSNNPENCQANKNNSSENEELEIIDLDDFS